MNYMFTLSIIFIMTPNTHSAIIITIHQINTSIIGSMSLERFDIWLSSSSWYIMITVSNVCHSVAVFSHTLISAATVLGMSVVLFLIQS